MTKMNLKRGKLNADELQFIRDNLNVMTNEQIGERLRRSPALVNKYRQQEPETKRVDGRDATVSELRAKHFWPDIKRILLAHEIPYFEQEWAKHIYQFQTNEIVATDEGMIRDLIIEDIMYMRALKERRKNMAEIAEAERRIDVEQAKPREQRDKALEALLHTQRQALLQALPTLSREQTIHAERKDAKLNQLKATRSARYKQVVESRKNFFELLRELDMRESRKKEGRWMELMRQGGEKIKKDWGAYREYADGSVDRPLLTPETVGETK